MTDLILRYRECGAECREDWLRMLACDNGLSLNEVGRAAARLCEREDFGRLVDSCEGGRCCDRLKSCRGMPLSAQVAPIGDELRLD